MEICSLSFFSTLKPPLSTNNFKPRRALVEVSACSYQKFLHFALDETKRRTHLLPSPLQEDFNSMMAIDGKTQLQMVSFQAAKIRLLRSLSIEESEGMQILDFAAFPEPEFDLPIFCANFFSTPTTNIIVLDLNPLYDVINQRDYKEKYYRSLMPLGLKYAKLLPWGGKLTSESLRFFSPIVIWTKFTTSQYNHGVLYSAFMDYYKAWLELMKQATPERHASQISCNREAQHRYLTWRAEKPVMVHRKYNCMLTAAHSRFGVVESQEKIVRSHYVANELGASLLLVGLNKKPFGRLIPLVYSDCHRILKKLIGESLSKDLVRNFLFNGVDELGTKTFLDYFPEYCCESGTINTKRSIIGKSFESRPWDASGEFIGKL